MPEEPLSIGEVIDLLKDEFPDVSVSKLRFLESQGLVSPARADSGYRQFDSEDLKRIRFILTQQRDHFLPLKVIKSKLTLWERGEDPGPDAEPPAQDPLDQEGEPMTRSDLVRRSGLSEKDFDALLEHGLLAPVGDSTVFSPDALTIAIECRRLMEVGLEARHLRTVRLSAQREAELLRQLTAHLLSSPSAEARARARDLLAACSDSVQALHRAILTAEVRALLHE
ncbi:MAG TPA: MerR family transcriptional regulator [Acidimicrobiia bacterium]|nr:MerR family transcriptional regulator [Acidimicrobiia bacterium]